MSSVIDLVRRAYGTLDVDDVPSFLELCSDDAAVEYPASGQLAYGGHWQGRDAIARFFERHDEVEEILDFEPADMAADGNTVFVRGFFRSRSRLTGRTWQTGWVHVFQVDDGALRRWQAYFDTAAAIEAHRWR